MHLTMRENRTVSVILSQNTLNTFEETMIISLLQPTDKALSISTIIYPALCYQHYCNLCVIHLEINNTARFA